MSKSQDKPTTINFFALTAHISLNMNDFKMPKVGSSYNIYIVEFQTANLENPTTEPIGVFFSRGMRRYLWRDRYWAEYAMPHRAVNEILAGLLRDCINKDEALRLRTWMGLINKYAGSVGPTNADMVDNPTSAGKVFYRAIYEINDE